MPICPASCQVPVLANLVTDPGVRRSGLGAALVARCEEAAKTWGYTEVPRPPPQKKKVGRKYAFLAHCKAPSA